MSAHLSQVDYEYQAQFRHALRGFLRYSEEVTQAEGTTPQQYQTLLVIQVATTKGHTTIGDVAERLLICHHSAGALVDRLVNQGLVTRDTNPHDRRQVSLKVTPRGARLLEKLVILHQNELRRLGSRLLDPLSRVIQTPVVDLAMFDIDDERDAEVATVAAAAS